MGLPFRAMSATANAEEAAKLSKIINVDGKSMKVSELVDLEIKKVLANRNLRQADVMKSLQKYGVEIDPNWVKTRINVFKQQESAAGIKPPDRRHGRMEANFIIEKGISENKTWDEISDELVQGGFNGPKLVENAAKIRQKQMMNKAPAAIDEGSGPQGPQDDPPVYSGPLSPDYRMDLSKLTDEDLKDMLKEAATEAGRRRSHQFDQARKAGKAGDDKDWSWLQELGKTWAEDPNFGDSRISTKPELSDPNAPRAPTEPVNPQPDIPQE